MRKYSIKATKTITFTNGSSVLVYLESVNADGFGKTQIIFTNYSGTAPIAAGQVIELDEARIKPVVGSDGKSRQWYI